MARSGGQRGSGRTRPDDGAPRTSQRATTPRTTSQRSASQNGRRRHPDEEGLIPVLAGVAREVDRIVQRPPTRPAVRTKFQVVALLVREERILATIKERLAPIVALRQELADLLPIDTAFLSTKALDGLPNAAILAVGAAVPSGSRQAAPGQGRR